ncbi:MAG: DNA-3-methyladenine glycosylase 2 family protein [Clostridia bacterium]|nr:DNA-3-methyladenine glycosylase 2 family protein [Clostridia bacterium]
MSAVVYTSGNDTVIEGIECFSISDTLDCGQAFRWQEDTLGHWHGIASGRYLEIYKENNLIILKNTSKEEFEGFWRSYFDIDRDYAQIVKKISDNDVLKKASEIGGGIRILRQDPWETICSFIISQNNNIPRIKGIITRLCENFGEKCNGGYTFPTAEKIATLTLEDLSVLRSGFRAKYILDGAMKYANGEIREDILLNGNIDDARSELEKIKGVGPKVADCVLLFGYGRIEAFPRDVWIKRAMEKLFGGKLPKEAKGYEGIVQQYLFHYARKTKLEI